LDSKLNKAIIQTVLLGLVCCPGFGDEGAPGVMPLLKGYEWQFNPDQFRALPADSYQELLRIAGSVEYPGHIRERALAALSIYPNDAVWSFMYGDLRNSADGVRRRRLVEAMCVAFAGQRPREVEDAIVKMLDSADPHLRVKVAKCLKTLDSESAREQLDHYRSRITESWEAVAVDGEEIL
jgi:hypothetical protein